MLHFGLASVVSAVGVDLGPAAILPPDTGFNRTSFLLQVACTGLVILLVLIVRSVTLPGADAGLHRYIGTFAWRDLTPAVMVAATGQAIFPLSLGGTFMVTHGSYMEERAPLLGSAVWTVFGDTAAGLMAGFIIFPAVFAFGMNPGSGPGLLFDTFPKVFAQMPGGALFGALFFFGLFGAAYLSDIAAFEVLVAGLVDNLGMDRKRAVRLMAVLVGVVALVPMLNLKVFVLWDLTFGSGMQALGALLTVLTAGWFFRRGALLEQLGDAGPARTALVVSIRYLVPLAMLAVAIWWLLADALHWVNAV